jgi:hypothetical protein
MVFNATFNNISVISWRSVLLVHDTGVLRENHRPALNHRQALSHNVVSSAPRLLMILMTSFTIDLVCTSLCLSNNNGIKVPDTFLEFRSLMDCNINLFLRVTFTTIILNIEHKLVLIFHLSRTKSSHYEQCVRYC